MSAIMNVAQRGLLLGMIFGDGYVKPGPSKKTASLVVKHSDKQASYVEHKADLVCSAIGGARPNVRKIQNNGFPGVRFAKTNKVFRLFRKRLYCEGKKRISPYIRWLTPHGLAIWYMDDGGLGIKKRNGRIHAVDLYLNCHCDIVEAMAISAEIERKWSIKFVPNINNGKYRLRCGTREARRFIEIIEPFIIDDMRYKIAIPTKAHERPARKG
jgi:hypothetical protein